MPKESSNLSMSNKKKTSSYIRGRSSNKNASVNRFSVSQSQSTQPNKTNQNIINCPYVFWQMYFKNELYVNNHLFLPEIEGFIDFFENDNVKIFDEYIDLSDYKEKLFILVEYRLLRDHCKLEGWDTKLKTQPLEFLPLISLAASEVFHKTKAFNKQYKTKCLVRVINLDKLTHLKNLKSNLMGNFIQIRGSVVRVSSIKPIVIQMSFICSNCLQTQVEYFVDGKYQLPSKCSTFSCKGKSFSPQRGVEADGKTKTMDWQKIRIQEKLADDQVDSGRIPRTVECEVTEDLVDLVAPGDVISVSGIVKMHATEEGKGKPNQTQMYILYIDVNSLVKASTNPGETLDEDDEGSSGFTKDFISFSTKDLMGIREIKRFGGNNVFRLLVNSLCPAIFGHELVKAGLILGLLGGRKRTNASNKDINIRGDPHILVVGDPGLGKSQMLSAAVKAAPRGVFVCGNSTTTSGLTVTMTKDSETGETALEAGALVLGDQGICCIDEFDKMGEHQALLEAMEQQSISIAKAGIVCNLPARTSVIAAANPVGGHYNKSKTVSENLRMNSALLSRFDLVFILLDKPDVEKDKFISDHIMKVHAGGFKKKERTIYQNIGSNKVQSQIRFNGDELQLEESLKIHSSEVFEPIPVSLLRKYIAYARKYCRPKLTVEASAILQEFYLDLRNKYRSVDTIPITTRQLESMIRLSEARAKAELREFVDKYDAIDVVELMKHSLMESYKDENNMLDFHRSQHGTGMSKKGEPKRFIAELNRISYQTCNKNFSYEELFSIAKGIKLNFTSFQDLIDSLNNQTYLIKKGPRMYELTTSG